MSTVRYRPDRRRPARLSAEDAAALDRRTPADALAAAQADPDNPPLTSADLWRLRAARLAKDVRNGVGLTQTTFASRYGIKLSRLRDLEQGRHGEPDAVLVSLLALIRDDPERTRRVVGGLDLPA